MAPARPGSRVDREIDPPILTASRRSTVIVAGDESVARSRTSPGGSVAALRSPAITAAVPPAAPVAPPIAAPLPPPRMRAEDRAADRGAADLLARCRRRRLAVAEDRLGAQRRPRCRRRAPACGSGCRGAPASLTLPPLVDLDHVPITREPAGIATRPAAITSRETRASTRSSTRARSDRQRRFHLQADHRRGRQDHFLELRLARRLGLRLDRA